MKSKLFILTVLMALVLMVQPAVASVITATMGDMNSSGEYRLKADSDGLFTFASDSSIKFPYQSGTTTDTLTAADSGRIYVVTYSAAQVSADIIKLPAAAVGMVYPIVSATTNAIAVVPNGTDIINYASLSAGDSIINTSAAKGDAITFICVVANEWSVVINSGTWADAGGFGD